jgi:acyl-[acyl carrier protein]--UDP-N-acetylglucosamine O-acyltransferase
MSKKTIKHAIQSLETKADLPAQVKELIQFIKSSSRGICTPRRTAETGASETW